jgi:hypothetical protein
MPSESLHDTPSEPDVLSPGEVAGQAEDSNIEIPAESPVDLSQFSQRLASFGLGEAPDPLLTESRRPSKHRPRR